MSPQKELQRNPVTCTSNFMKYFCRMKATLLLACTCKAPREFLKWVSMKSHIHCVQISRGGGHSFKRRIACQVA